MKPCMSLIPQVISSELILYLILYCFIGTKSSGMYRLNYNVYVGKQRQLKMLGDFILFFLILLNSFRSVCKESSVQWPGASGFCYRASEFLANGQVMFFD